MASGGKRAGAGRPKLAERRETVAARVLPETKKIIDKLKANGFNLGRWIDDQLLGEEVPFKLDSDAIDMMNELKEVGFDIAEDFKTHITFRWMSKVIGRQK